MPATSGRSLSAALASVVALCVLGTFEPTVPTLSPARAFLSPIPTAMAASSHRNEAVPSDRTRPIRAGGYPEFNFIHDVVAPKPEVHRMLEEVSEDSLTANVRHLENYGTRFVYSPQVLKAGRWLMRRLAGFGYSDTLYQRVTPDGMAPLASGNVVAGKTGTTVPGFSIIVGGHYDSVISSAHTSPMTLAPGADDNASGTAATLEIARLLADRDLDATVRFVFFTAEEIGLYGSAQMATQMVADGIRPENVFVINMDMIANADSFPREVGLYYDSLSEPLAGLCAMIGKAYSDPTPVMAGPFHQSDHYPFQQRGYPAIFVHEGDLNPNRHTVNDRLAHLEMDYATEVVRMVLATVLHTARIAEPPDAVEASETASGELLIEWDHSVDADVLGYRVELIDPEGDPTAERFTRDNYLVLSPTEALGARWARVRAQDMLGESRPSEAALISPDGFVVSTASPNPTTGKTRLDLYLPGAGGELWTAAKVFDASGRLVRTVHDGPLSRGSNRLEWDGAYGDGGPAPAGIYLYVIEVAGMGRARGKIVIAR
jgi:hypothetical protein